MGMRMVGIPQRINLTMQKIHINTSSYKKLCKKYQCKNFTPTISYHDPCPALQCAVQRMYLRMKTFKPGPILPIPIMFPCTININDELTFVFGQEVAGTIGMNISLISLIYDQKTNTWTDISQHFPCPFIAINKNTGCG